MVGRRWTEIFLFLCALTDPVERSRIEKLYLDNRLAFLSLAYKKVQNIHAAEDIVQEAFQKIVERPDLLKDDAVKNRLLLGILIHNETEKYLQKQNREIPGLPGFIFSGSCPLEYLLRKEVVQFVQKVYKELPTIYQDAIHLKYEMGLSNTDISWLLNISYDTVRQRLSRAVRKSREKLKERGL